MTTRMKYKRYKEHYNDCETVVGSYDKSTKTIEVIVPQGRMKKSGVRGQQFAGYAIWFIGKDGERYYCTYRAVSKENALKQHKKMCSENGYTFTDEIKHVF